MHKVGAEEDLGDERGKSHISELRQQVGGDGGGQRNRRLDLFALDLIASGQSTAVSPRDGKERRERVRSKDSEPCQQVTQSPSFNSIPYVGDKSDHPRSSKSRAVKRAPWGARDVNFAGWQQSLVLPSAAGATEAGRSLDSGVACCKEKGRTCGKKSTHGSRKVQSTVPYTR